MIKQENGKLMKLLGEKPLEREGIGTYCQRVVKPDSRRLAAVELIDAHQLSQSRACQRAGLHR